MVAPNSLNQFANHLELVLPHPKTTKTDVQRICAQAITLGAASVCVSGSRVVLARDVLDNTAIQVSSVIAFPLGVMDTDAKRYEVEVVVDNGAQELDVVVNHALLLDGEDKLFFRELRDVVEAADERPVKFLLEPDWLTVAQLERACRMIRESSALCLGVGTGFGPRQVTLEDVKLARSLLGDDFPVKVTLASYSRQIAEGFFQAGIFRVGLLGPIKDASWQGSGDEGVI